MPDDNIAEIQDSGVLNDSVLKPFLIERRMIFRVYSSCFMEFHDI